MFRRRKARPTPAVPPQVDGACPDASPLSGEASPCTMAILVATDERCTASGEYLVVPSVGRVIVTACDMPAPWSLGDRAYTSYACYLEESGSGNRIRIDMCRASDRDWVAVRRFSTSLEAYDRACVCPVADGAVGQPLLSTDARTPR